MGTFNSKVEPPLGTDCVRLSRVYCIYVIITRTYFDTFVKKNQPDAQFILSIFRQTTSTSIAHHQEVQPYVYNIWYLLVLGFQSNQHNRQSSEKNNKYQMLYTYGCSSWWWAIDMPETCRSFFWRNIRGESNGKLPLKIRPGCSVPEPYQSPDWALVSAQTGPRAEYR
jgi:hypothetical protein